MLPIPVFHRERLSVLIIYVHGSKQIYYGFSWELSHMLQINHVFAQVSIIKIHRSCLTCGFIKFKPIYAHIFWHMMAFKRLYYVQLLKFVLSHTNVKTLHDNNMGIVLSVSAYFHKMHVIKMTLALFDILLLCILFQQ